MMGHSAEVHAFVDQYPELADIPDSSNWSFIADMREAGMTEPACRVADRQDRRYILRIADRTQYDRTKREYEYLQIIYNQGAPVPEPLGYGFCGGGRKLYLLTQDVTGRSLPFVISGMPPECQYALGIDIGLLLKTIHLCPIPCGKIIRPDQFSEQMSKLDARCRTSRLRGPSLQKLRRIIASGQDAMQPRPTALLHGNFRPDQVMMAPEYGIRIRNLAGWRYGDPFLDLANALSSFRAISIPFATGILDCYFIFAVSETILRQLSTYAAASLLEQYLETDQQSRESEEKIRRLIEQFCGDFSGEQNVGPAWFRLIRKAIIDA